MRVKGVLSVTEVNNTVLFNNYLFYVAALIEVQSYQIYTIFNRYVYQKHLFVYVTKNIIVSDFPSTIHITVSPLVYANWEVPAARWRRLFHFRRRWSQSISYQPLAVHICPGRVIGVSTPAASVDSQQRSANTVSQQLLCKVAQQFIDSGWVNFFLILYFSFKEWTKLPICNFFLYSKNTDRQSLFFTQSRHMSQAPLL